MATLSEALKALAGIENGSEFVDAVKGELSKKDSETKKLRDATKKSEGDLQAFMSELGIDNTATIDDVKKALEAKATEADGSPENKRLSTQVDTLTKQMEQWKKQAEDEKQKRLNTIKQKAISEALTESKALSPQVLTKALNSQVKVNDDESLFYVNDDGSEVELSEGIKGFLNSNPNLVSNQQISGSGGSGNSSQSNTMSYEEASKLSMPEYMKARREGREG